MYTGKIKPAYSITSENRTIKQTQITINPFPHIDASAADGFAQNEQFLLLPQCFPLFDVGYTFSFRDFLIFEKICSKSSAAELSYAGKG